MINNTTPETFVKRFHRLRTDDSGMSTVEYAVGLITAAGLAAILFAVLSSDAVRTALAGLVERALDVTF